MEGVAIGDKPGLHRERPYAGRVQFNVEYFCELVDAGLPCRVGEPPANSSMAVSVSSCCAPDLVDADVAEYVAALAPGFGGIGEIDDRVPISSVQRHHQCSPPGALDIAARAREPLFIPGSEYHVIAQPGQATRCRLPSPRSPR